MLAVAGLRDRRFEPAEFLAVFAEEFTVAGKVVLFQGGRAEGTFRVEKPGELGYQTLTLCPLVRDRMI